MSQASPNKIRRSPQEWVELMAEYEASNFTQREFCEHEQLAYSTFCYWRKRLSGNAPCTAAATVSTPPLLELPGLDVHEQTGWRVELELGSGVILRLR